MSTICEVLHQLLAANLGDIGSPPSSSRILWCGLALPTWLVQHVGSLGHCVWVPGHFSPAASSTNPAIHILPLDFHVESPTLPFDTASFDQVIVMLAPLSDRSLRGWGQEWSRVLSQAGQLSLVALGPQTFDLSTLGEMGLDAGAIFQPQLDMHDLGDIMAASRLRDVVVASHQFSFRYRQVKTLQKDMEFLTQTLFADPVAVHAEQFYQAAAKQMTQSGSDARFEIDVEAVILRAVSGVVTDQSQTGHCVSVPISEIKRGPVMT